MENTRLHGLHVENFPPYQFHLVSKYTRILTFRSQKVCAWQNTPPLEVNSIHAAGHAVPSKQLIPIRIKFIEWRNEFKMVQKCYVLVTRWSVDVLYSAAYTFIDIWRAVPATKLLATSSYMFGFYIYGWGSRAFRNITIDSIYILI